MSYVWAGILVSFIALGLFAFKESNKVDTLETANKTLTASVEASESARKKEQQDAIDANNRRSEYLENIDKMQNEINTLRSNVNTGVTVLRVAAKCPVPSVAADTSGAIATTPELEENARSAYYTHIADEDKLNGLLDMCVGQLKSDRGIK